MNTVFSVLIPRGVLLFKIPPEARISTGTSTFRYFPNFFGLAWDSKCYVMFILCCLALWKALQRFQATICSPKTGEGGSIKGGGIITENTVYSNHACSTSSMQRYISEIKGSSKTDVDAVLGIWIMGLHCTEDRIEDGSSLKYRLGLTLSQIGSQLKRCFAIGSTFSSYNHSSSRFSF